MRVHEIAYFYFPVYSPAFIFIVFGSFLDVFFFVNSGLCDVMAIFNFGYLTRVEPNFHVKTRLSAFPQGTPPTSSFSPALACCVKAPHLQVAACRLVRLFCFRLNLPPRDSNKIETFGNWDCFRTPTVSWVSSSRFGDLGLQ